MPLFFASLMAASLAVEKPRVVEWQAAAAGIARIWHQPTARDRGARSGCSRSYRRLILVAVSWIAAHFPYAIYVTCVAASVEALALTIRLHRWEVHHTARFAYGEDLLADQTTSSSLQRGEWEHDAAETVRSLVHYTIGLSIVAAGIALYLTYRRRRARRSGRTGG